MDGTARRLADRDDTQDPPTRRITVYFDGPTPEDALVLEYAATRTEAWEFTSAAAHAGLTVTVDAKVSPGLRRLPCRSLWR
ncbi:hypothetical protein [Nocardia sp. NPDC057455]|uniref:hypothetical protein n=1 Tax=Nocardia sp. NPDC057455 TaxID=3346138 RepID=UPI003671A654